MSEERRERGVCLFVDRVGVQYGVQSVLDTGAEASSRAGGSLSRLLAARGVRSMVADPRNEGGLPEADLVVAFDVPEVGAGWEESLVARARALVHAAGGMASRVGFEAVE